METNRVFEWIKQKIIIEKLRVKYGTKIYIHKNDYSTQFKYISIEID